MKDDSPDWRIEAPRLIRLATPIFIGQMAQIGMGVTDTIMAGHYSAQDLAAIAIGQSIWLPVYVFYRPLYSLHHPGSPSRWRS